MNRLSAFRTVSDAAAVAARMLADDEPLSRVWRFSIMQMLDDYASVLRHDGVTAAGGCGRTRRHRQGTSGWTPLWRLDLVESVYHGRAVEPKVQFLLSEIVAALHDQDGPPTPPDEPQP